jgi:hypothetical protein
MAKSYSGRHRQAEAPKPIKRSTKTSKKLEWHKPRRVKQSIVVRRGIRSGRGIKALYKWRAGVTETPTGYVDVRRKQRYLPAKWSAVRAHPYVTKPTPGAIHVAMRRVKGGAHDVLREHGWQDVDYRRMPNGYFASQRKKFLPDKNHRFTGYRATK